MKNRQFITILAVVLVWFIYLWYRVDTLERVVRNVDENVATVDGRLVWDILPKVESIYNNN